MCINICVYTNGELVHSHIIIGLYTEEPVRLIAAAVPASPSSEQSVLWK